MRDLFGTRRIELTTCICPECGVIHSKRLDVSYIVKPDIQKRAGYIVLLCKDCGKSIDKNKREEQKDDNNL